MNIAAKMGIACSYVRVDRARKACKNARFVLLYVSSSASDIVKMADVGKCGVLLAVVRVVAFRTSHFAAYI